MSTVRRLASAVVVASLAVVVGVPGEHGDGVAATTAPAADQTFTDAGGDSVGRLDIRSVRVTSSGDNLDFRVNLAQKTIGTTEHTAIELDLNSDGARDLAFYFRGDSGGTIRHVRYPSPGTFEVTPASLGTFSNNDFGITFNLRLGALGNPSRFQFEAFTKEYDEPRVWDSAPDTGRWAFVVQEQQPPGGGGGGGGGGGESPDFVASRSVIEPSPPRAGEVVVLAARFEFRDSGQVVRTGVVRCTGSIGAQRLRVVYAGFQSNSAGCGFRLPQGSAGKTFTGRVTVTRGTRERSVQRSARIVGAANPSAKGKLVISDPNTNGDPKVGQQFATSFKVVLVRAGTSKRVTSGRIECRATAGGRTVPFAAGGWDPDDKGNKSAYCTWPIPGWAKGETFRGTITVRSGEATGTKPFTRRVR
jgi:hypothetical protein